MPTESQAAEARRLLTQHAVQLKDIDQKIKDLVVYRDQQVQSVLEKTEAEIKGLQEGHQAALTAIKEQKRTRISAIQRRWKEKTVLLRTEREQIQLSSYAQRFILAPVRKLPLELLVNIFEHFICEDGSPWTLALVSVAWSEVMFSTCSLWSKVHVDINTACTKSANSLLRRLKAHLRRAGTRCLLDVHLVCKFEYAKHTTKQVLKACELIGGRDMLERWRSVTLIGGPFALTQEQLEPLFAHPLPNLRSLSVESKRSNLLLDILNEMIDTSAKALRILSVDKRTLGCLIDYPNTLQRVEVLRYTDESVYHLAQLEAFPLMRALKEVEVTGYILEHCQTPDWIRGVETATFFRLSTSPTILFDPQKDYLHNLRQLSLISCPPFYLQRPWIKTPNLRVLKVDGHLETASFFDTPILDDLCLISHVRTMHLGNHESVVFRDLYNSPFGAPKIRHLQLNTVATTAETIEFLKKVPWLERLTIQEFPYGSLSYDLFAALKEVAEDVVHSDGPPQGEMAMCPTYQNLTMQARFTGRPHLSEVVTEAVPVRSNPPPQGKMALCPTLQNLTIKTVLTTRPELSEWVTEVVTVRRNLGESFEGIVLRVRW